MKIRKGLSGGQYKPLTEEDIAKIHETSMNVFSEIGVQVNFAEARELFHKAGAEVDESSRIVRAAPDLVQALIAKAPSLVTLCGRGENDEAENNFTPQQFESLAEVLDELCGRYPDAEVLGHRDLPDVQKECPAFDVRGWLNEQKAA